MRKIMFPIFLLTLLCLLINETATAQEKIGLLDFKGGDSLFLRMLARTAPYPGFDEPRSDNYFFQIDVSAKDNKVRIFEKTGKKTQATGLLIGCLYKLAEGITNSTGHKQSIIVPIFVTRENIDGIVKINPDSIQEKDFKRRWLSKRQVYLSPMHMFAYEPIRCSSVISVDPSEL